MSTLGFITLCVAVAGVVTCGFAVWAYRREMSDLFFPRRDLQSLERTPTMRPVLMASAAFVHRLQPSLERTPTHVLVLSDVSLPVWPRHASEPGEDLLRSAEAAVEAELRLAESLDGAGEAASDAKRIRRKAMELAVILRRLRAQMSHG